jgi:hypothetical protein
LPRDSRSHGVPPSTFLTSSTASSSIGLAGLFHPAATSGIRSPGVFPPTQPCRLVACRCPHAGWGLPPADGCPSAPGTCSPSPGPFSARESVAHRQGLVAGPPDPLLSFSFFGFFFARRADVLDRRPLRPRPFPALGVSPTRDLPCSCEPDSPVQGSWPALPSACALFRARPAFQAIRFDRRTDSCLCDVRTNSRRARNDARSHDRRTVRSVAFLITVVNKLRIICAAHSRFMVGVRSCVTPVHENDIKRECRRSRQLREEW